MNLLGWDFGWVRERFKTGWHDRHEAVEAREWIAFDAELDMLEDYRNDLTLGPIFKAAWLAAVDKELIRIGI